ncbi:DEKNAAC101210 [Brettanomyces naardenensis]|uniref:DEKNAAC101210 n=1 Tax=Brettanomyces naardenensis TaxID=13370 RepID=A0A448YHF6_BRENA|nr:DEKNAAC101210 [Brettanomyces naardenensis]
MAVGVSYVSALSSCRLQSTFRSSMSADELSEQRLKGLTTLAEKEFFSEKQGNSDSKSEVAFDILNTCKVFQDSVYNSDKLDPENNPLIKQSNKLIEKILKNKELKFDDELLGKLFRLQPHYPTLKTIVETYYSRSPDAYIDSDMAMIPFRKLVWDADFQRALDYIELTTGSKRYFEHRRSLVKRYLWYFGGSMAGLVGTIHLIVTVYFPELLHSGTGGTRYGIYGIYAMIVSYFVNCGFLATISFSSKGMENGSLLFKHGSMPWDWYCKVDQMKMCSKVLEADAAIHGMEGFATREIVSRISSMGFDVNEPEQEVMMRQYWYSSGEGFVWVEPDLDPAELEWWDHLDKVGVKKFWDPDYDKLGQGEEEENTVEDEEDEGEEEDLILPEK